MQFLVTMEGTKAASVYLGKQTFPLHPDLRTSLHGSWQHQSLRDGARGGEAPSSHVHHSSPAGKQQVQDED